MKLVPVASYGDLIRAFLCGAVKDFWNVHMSELACSEASSVRLILIILCWVHRLLPYYGIMGIETEMNGVPITNGTPTLNGTPGAPYGVPGAAIINGVPVTDINSQEKPLIHFMKDYPDKSILDLTKECVESAAQYSRHIQNSDGHWCGELRSNPTVTSEYVFLHQALGLDLAGSRESIRPWLLSQQKDDGSWGIAPDYPGDVSTSVEAYLALKILQIPAEDPVMQRARAFILSVGGLAKIRIFSRIYLATFGLFPWSDIPEMPAELVFVSLISYPQISYPQISYPQISYPQILSTDPIHRSYPQILSTDPIHKYPRKYPIQY